MLAPNINPIQVGIIVHQVLNENQQTLVWFYFNWVKDLNITVESMNEPNDSTKYYVKYTRTWLVPTPAQSLQMLDLGENWDGQFFFAPTCSTCVVDPHFWSF